ncbi:class I tRNA ligase family protein [archaeon]|nr:class I tRNA ligase family protein [archaeon]
MQAVHYNSLPYKKLLVHGFVLDEKKLKYSKSSGNGLSAKDAVNLFGSDVLRL